MLIPVLWNVSVMASATAMYSEPDTLGQKKATSVQLNLSRRAATDFETRVAGGFVLAKVG